MYYVLLLYKNSSDSFGNDKYIHISLEIIPFLIHWINSMQREQIGWGAPNNLRRFSCEGLGA